MNVYLAIVCGNYETKLLVGTIENENLRIMYIDVFLTNEIIIDSILIDSERFEEILSKKIKEIKKIIGLLPNKIIMNIPTKSIDIISSTSNEYKISKYLTEKKWNKILSSLSLSINQTKNSVLLGKKVYSWILDEEEYLEPPFNIEGHNLIFKTQYYITDKRYVEPFKNVFQKLKLEVNEIVVDPMIITEGFKNNLRSNKAFINIGHDKSNFFYYKNFAINKKNIIDFGLKNLTYDISKNTGINEQEAINFLKIYKNISSFGENSIPFKISILEEMGKYNSFDNKKINELIIKWLNRLTIEINFFCSEVSKINEEIDEIYILSATNIFEKWIHYIKAKLDSKIDVLYINNNNIKLNNKNLNVIGFNEPKYTSLIYSLFYLYKEIL